MNRKQILTMSLSAILLVGHGTAWVGAAQAEGGDREVIARSLVVRTGGPTGSHVVYKAGPSLGIEKGPDGDPAALDAEVEILYLDGSTTGTLTMPSPFYKNSESIARYKNPVAPTGSPVKSMKLRAKDKRRLRFHALALGGLNIANSPGDAGVKVVVTVNNSLSGAVYRMCTEFKKSKGSRILHRSANGRSKLVLKNGVGTLCEPACADGFKNGDETGVDCGGQYCGLCPDGEGCNVAGDCANGVCLSGTCQTPTCTDGVQNGPDETDVDCGGGTCPACPDLSDCTDSPAPPTASQDCQSGVCIGGLCQTPTCLDGVKNAAETDVDCGGGLCPACGNGLACSDAPAPPTPSQDCQSGVCSGGICQTPTNTDGVKNGDETDVDCGGSSGNLCGIAKDCLVAGDCITGICDASTQKCLPAFCVDGVQNGTETDVDCGGACSGCTTGETCSVAGDCQSGVCTGSVCIAPNCSDGVRNGNESDVDCGGGDCTSCADGKVCIGPLDCTSFTCGGNICQTANCSDGIKNGLESDIDCGGPICAKCHFGDDCNGNADCDTNACNGVTCSCGGKSFSFFTTSNGGGLFDSAEWPGSTATSASASGCSVTVQRPSGNIDLVGNLGDRWQVNSFVGFSSCFGSGGEDGDGCQANYCPPAGIPSCEANRPSCSAALNGTGGTTFYVTCAN